MGKPNPLRGQYLLQGLDFVRAGILNGYIIREDNKVVLPSAMPAEERWISSRAFGAAAAKLGAPVDAAQAEAGPLLPFLKQDNKFKVWTTEERIVAIMGGETPENRAFAQAEIAALEANYGVASVAKVKAA